MLARSLLLAALVLAASASPALADKGGRHRGDWTQGFDQRGGRNDDGDRNKDFERKRIDNNTPSGVSLKRGRHGDEETRGHGDIFRVSVSPRLRVFPRTCRIILRDSRR